jgi:hypothetical protein
LCTIAYYYEVVSCHLELLLYPKHQNLNPKPKSGHTSPLVTWSNLYYNQLVKRYLLVTWEDEADWTGLICD